MKVKIPKDLFKIEASKGKSVLQHFADWVASDREAVCRVWMTDGVFMIARVTPKNK